MKIEKVTLTKVNKTQRTSSKTGKPFTSVGIITVEYGDKKWLSGFENKKTENWREGDVVEIVVEQKGEYLNFKTPDVEARATMVTQEIENRQRTMWTDLQNLTARVVKLEKMNGIDPQASAFPERKIEEPDETQIPF